MSASAAKLAEFTKNCGNSGLIEVDEVTERMSASAAKLAKYTKNCGNSGLAEVDKETERMPASFGRKCQPQRQPR